MKKIFLFSFFLGIFFLHQILIADPKLIKYFAYQDVETFYSWGRMKIKMQGTWKKKDYINSIVGNPYSIKLFVENNYKRNCLADLNYLSLMKDGKIIYENSNKQDVFDDTSKSKKLAVFVLNDVLINDYDDYEISLKFDIICNNQIFKSIEEEKLLLKTKYSEEKVTVFDQLLSI